MSADQELQDTCREWRRLARAEGEAIRTLNWPLATDCQLALQALQPRLTRCLQDAREDRFRAVLAELIEIETRNNALLNGVRQTAQSQLSQLNQAGRNLRHVKRSYLSHPPAARDAFS
jgi:hypothetical protein